jgi:hypothetical protein
LIAVVGAVEDILRVVVVHLAVKGSRCFCCHSVPVLE